MLIYQHKVVCILRERILFVEQELYAMPCGMHFVWKCKSL